jgi:hypothetical protein
MKRDHPPGKPISVRQHWRSLPGSRSRQSPPSRKGCAGKGCIGWSLFLFVALFVVAFLLEISILYAVFKALHKILSSERDREEFGKFLIVLVFCSLLVGVILVAVEPDQIQIFPLPLPWHYLIGLLTLPLIGGLVWGAAKHRWLQAFGSTLVSFTGAFLEGMQKFWQSLFDMV